MGQMTKEKKSEVRSRQLRYLTWPSLVRDAERRTKPKDASGHGTLSRADGKLKKRKSNRNQQKNTVAGRHGGMGGVVDT